MELKGNFHIPMDAIPWDYNTNPTFCAAKTGAHLLLGVRVLLQGFLGVLCLCVVAATAAFPNRGCRFPGIISFPSWMLGSQGTAEKPFCAGLALF